MVDDSSKMRKLARGGTKIRRNPEEDRGSDLMMSAALVGV